MRRARMVVACGCTLMAAAAPAADAASLSIYDGGGEVYHDGMQYHVTYRADPGEANRVTASYNRATRTFRLSDPSTPVIRPMPDVNTPWAATVSCQYGVSTVVCKHDEAPPETLGYGSFQFTFHLADGNDTAWIAVDVGTTTLYGGDGNDSLRHSGTGSAWLLGEGGNDSLVGGIANENFWGGPGADRIDGGDGDGDRITYPTDLDPEAGTVGVTVSLDGVANDGDPGERDNILGTIDRIAGTNVDDVLIGDGGTQTFLGEGGDDRIDGGGGADRLEGDDGNDQIDGGAGADTVIGRAGDDVVSGGAGTDSVYGQDTDRSTGVTLSDVDTIHVRDGERDNYGCGNYADTVFADPFDVFGYGTSLTGHPSECETVEVQ